MTLQELIRSLQDRNLSAVGRATGLSEHTLYRIVSGKVKPHRATVKVLELYLRGNNG